jgi:uncharacterized membrane protein YcaP (DUF421 family)
MRGPGRRQTGGLSTPDVLLVILLADAAQNGMADQYRSVTEGVMLVGTIIFWNFAIDWLGFIFRPWSGSFDLLPCYLSRMDTSCAVTCGRNSSPWTN